jgi:hypothetical protein
MLLYVVGMFNPSLCGKERTKLNFIILSNIILFLINFENNVVGKKRFGNLCTLILKGDDFAQCSLGRVISQCID